MIKKSTRIIFEGLEIKNNELIGGVPLSVGESVNVKLDNGKKFICKVVDKKVIFEFRGKNQIAEITYKLKKK